MPPPEEYVLPTSEAWDRTSAAVRYTEGRRASQGGRPVPGVDGSAPVTVTVTGAAMALPGAAVGSFQPYPGYFLHVDDLSLGFLAGDPCYVRGANGAALRSGVSYKGHAAGTYNALAMVVVDDSALAGGSFENVTVAAAAGAGPGGLNYYDSAVELFTGATGTFSSGEPVWLVQEVGAPLTTGHSYPARRYDTATIGGVTRAVYVTVARPYMTGWTCDASGPHLFFS